MLTVRITMSKQTVNQMIQALHKAYQSGDARLIKRILVLLDFSRGDRVEVSTNGLRNCWWKG